MIIDNSKETKKCYMMRTNKWLFLSVLLALAVGHADAQSSDQARNPVKGYVITNDNDTIYGTIDYLSGEENATVCRFRRDGEAAFRQYGPDDIQGYRFMDDGVYYISRTFPLNGNEVRIFAEYLLKGGVSLYRYVTDDDTYFFMTNADGKSAAIKAKDYKGYNTEQARLLKRDNLYAASSLLSASSEATTSLWRQDITAFNLMNITRRYNEQFCTEAGDCVVFQYDEKKSALYHQKLRFEAGHNFCRIDNNVFSYSTNMAHFGIGLEATSSRLNPNLSIQVMLLGGIYNDVHFLSDTYEGKKRLWLQLDCGGLYRIASVGKTAPFIRGGVSVSLPMGAYAGAGWEFPLGRHRLQLTASYKYHGLLHAGSFITKTIDVAFLL
jgi:hypothetical protein